MACALYDKGRNKFARGELSWKVGGDEIRAFFVDSALYVRDLVEHEFVSDIPDSSRVGNGGASDLASAPILTVADPIGGVCDAADITFVAIPSGKTLEYLILFKNTGVVSTSPLIACLDVGTGLPVTTDGRDIIIEWDNGANKIFKL